jgi:hypothetical protein
MLFNSRITWKTLIKNKLMGYLFDLRYVGIIVGLVTIILGAERPLLAQSGLNHEN